MRRRKPFPPVPDTRDPGTDDRLAEDDPLEQKCGWIVGQIAVPGPAIFRAQVIAFWNNSFVVQQVLQTSRHAAFASNHIHVYRADVVS